MARKTEEFLLMLKTESKHSEKKLAKKDNTFPYIKMLIEDKMLEIAVISQILFFINSLSLIIKEIKTNKLNSKKLMPNDCL